MFLKVVPLLSFPFGEWSAVCGLNGGGKSKLLISNIISRRIRTTLYLHSPRGNLFREKPTICHTQGEHGFIVVLFL